jgi:hypothetical protein
MDSAPVRSFSPPPPPEPIDFDALIPPATFRKGLAARLSACPRCGGPVAHEPGCLHCLLCGRLWPVAGGAGRVAAAVRTGERAPERERVESRAHPALVAQ